MPQEYAILNDQDLLQLARDGDTLSFEELYHRHWPSMYNTAYKRLKNEEQCKDILQDVFSDLWKRRHTACIENIPAFLHTAVRYQVYKLAAKQEAGHEFFGLMEKIAVSPYEAGDKLLEKEFRHLIQTWMNTLPEKRRQIFQLHYREALNTRQIAEELGISQKTVQNQLGKALSHLRTRLAQLFSLLLVMMFFFLLCIL